MVPKIVTHYMLMDDLPQPLCGITAVFSAFTFFFHPMVLAMIACIRYLVIVPWTSRSRYVTLPRLKIAFGIIFSFAVIFSILPYLGVGVYKYSKYHGVCFADWEPENRIFRSIFYIFVIGVAFPVLTFAYTKLFLVLRDHNRDLEATIHRRFSFRNPQFTKIRSRSENQFDSYRSVDEMNDVGQQQFELKVITEENKRKTTQRKSRSLSAVEFTEFSKLRFDQQQQSYLDASSSTKNRKNKKNRHGTEGTMNHQHEKSKSTTTDILKISEKTEKRIYRTMTLTTNAHKKQLHEENEQSHHQNQDEKEFIRYGKKSITSVTSITSATNSTDEHDNEKYSNCGSSEDIVDASTVRDTESVCTMDEEEEEVTTTTTVTKRKTKTKKRSHHRNCYPQIIVKNEETLNNNNNVGQNDHIHISFKIKETDTLNNNKDQHDHIHIQEDTQGCTSEGNTKSRSLCDGHEIGLTAKAATQPDKTESTGSSEPENVTSITRTTMTASRRRRTRLMLGRSLSKQEYQFTKLMILIFLAYIVCWFPAAIVNVIALRSTCNVPEVWYAVIVTMVELKSCLNPLIYGIGNRQYRARIKVFFKKYFGFIGRCWY